MQQALQLKQQQQQQQQQLRLQLRQQQQQQPAGSSIDKAEFSQQLHRLQQRQLALWGEQHQREQQEQNQQHGIEWPWYLDWHTDEDGQWMDKNLTRGYCNPGLNLGLPGCWLLGFARLRVCPVAGCPCYKFYPASAFEDIEFFMLVTNPGCSIFDLMIMEKPAWLADCPCGRLVGSQTLGQVVARGLPSSN